MIETSSITYIKYSENNRLIHTNFHSEEWTISCYIQKQGCHSSVQFSCSVMSDFLWPLWTTAARPLSITNSQSSPKSMSIELVMPSNHLILCCPLHLLPSIFPSIRVFSNESALYIRWLKFGVSASTSVLPMNTQDWSPLGWTGWISLQAKGLSRVFSNITVQKHQFFGAQTITPSVNRLTDNLIIIFLITCLPPGSLHQFYQNSFSKLLPVDHTGYMVS